MSVNTKQLEKNIRLYQWYQFFFEPLFWGPILVLYIQEIGLMSLRELYYMEAIVVLGMVFLEIPSGALADLVGRKKVLLFGMFLMVVGIAGFAVVSTPTHVWIANILSMMGLALLSGADIALFYDSLKALGREGEFKRLEGRAASNRLFAVAILSLGVGYLYEIDPRLPMLLSIPGVMIAFGAVVCMRDVGVQEKYSYAGQVELIKHSVFFMVRHAQVRWVVGFMVFLTIISKLWFFTYNPYFELADIEPRYFGLIFFMIGMVSWFFSRYAHDLESRVGEYASVWIMVVAMAIPMVLMGSILSWAMAGLVLFQSAVRGYMRPFLMHFLNQHLKSSHRSTVISIKSAVNGVLCAISLWCFGAMLEWVDVPMALVFLGSLSAFIGLWFIILYRRIV